MEKEPLEERSIFGIDAERGELINFRIKGHGYCEATFQYYHEKDMYLHTASPLISCSATIVSDFEVWRR